MLNGERISEVPLSGHRGLGTICARLEAISQHHTSAQECPARIRLHSLENTPWRFMSGCA
jgi:hypothetical protein